MATHVEPPLLADWLNMHSANTRFGNLQYIMTAVILNIHFFIQCDEKYTPAIRTDLYALYMNSGTRVELKLTKNQGPA